MEEVLLITIPLYIFYIIILGLLMFKARVQSVKKGDVGVGYFKAYQGPSPLRLQILKNHYENQFQVPVLFFITVLTVILFQAVSLPITILAYLFIASRLVHTYVHLGKNSLKTRPAAFFSGVFLVLLMWVQFFITIK